MHPVERQPGGIQSRIVREDDRIEIVATYAGEEVRERVGLEVDKMDTEKQQFFLRQATVKAFRKLMRKLNKKALEAVEIERAIKGHARSRARKKV